MRAVEVPACVCRGGDLQNELPWLLIELGGFFFSW